MTGTDVSWMVFAFGWSSPISELSPGVYTGLVRVEGHY
jgi:hypothetical protein